MKPFFSICIPNYNYSQFIQETIESVLEQDFDDYEITQIDGYPGFSLSVQVDYVDPASKFRSVMSSPTNYKRIITSIGHDAEEILVDTLIFGSGL